MAFAIDLEVLAALVSVGTLATFFMISFGTLWRRYVDVKQPLSPALMAQLFGMIICSLGGPYKIDLAARQQPLCTASTASSLYDASAQDML